MQPARLALLMVTGAATLSAACGSEAGALPTQLVVAVHADSGLAVRLTRLRARVYPADAASSGAGSSSTLSFELSPSASDGASGSSLTLPISFAVVKKTAPELLLTVEGFEAGQKVALVEQKLRAAFPPKGLGLVRVFLSSACVGSACSTLDGTCDAAGGGACGDVPRAEVTRYPDVDALGDDELVSPDDPAPELACDTPEARDCGGAGGAPRVCQNGVWTREPACTAAAPCDPDTGLCTQLDEQCRDVCSPACADAGACPTDPCADERLCEHGACVAEGELYSCSCEAADGYRPSADGLACEDLPECDAPASTVCRGTGGSATAPFGYQYPCEELAPYYRCTGQLAEYAWRTLATGYRFFSRTYVQGELAPSFDPDSADNVVFDAITGLEWEQKLSRDEDITWENAMLHCGTVRTAGGGFRVPSYVELLGLVDDSGSSRALLETGGEPVAFDETLFPGPHDAWYWARDTRGTRMATAYLVTQINGVGGIFSEKRGERREPGDDPYLMRIRCVRPARAVR
jgi:Protein of unknown function (DUF1566)